MTLLAIFGCAPATRAAESSSVEGMIVEAVIEQITERLGADGEGFVANHVRVALHDREGRALEREDLLVKLNDVPLATRHDHGNFYDRHPFYRLDAAAAHLPADGECRFAIVRPDGTHHVAGVVRTPKAITPAQFTFPEKVSRRAPVTIGWRDLPESAELVICRSHVLTSLTGEETIEGGSFRDPTALRRTIGPGMFRRTAGRLEVPRSFLADHHGRRVCALGVEVTVTHEGEVREPFSRRSSFRAIRRLVFHADISD